MKDTAMVFIQNWCITTIWHCSGEGCNHECFWSMSDINESGIPICEKCGRDMNYSGTIIKEQVLEHMFDNVDAFSRETKEAILKENEEIYLKDILVRE